jgi:hypothetical protein
MYELDADKIKTNDKIFMIIPSNGDNPILTDKPVQTDSSSISENCIVLALRVEAAYNVEKHYKFVEKT